MPTKQRKPKVVPEPDGARMKVVKGASELNFNYIVPALAQPRHSIEYHWPKWDGERQRWVSSYKHLCNPPLTMLTIFLTPGGSCRLLFYNADGVPEVVQARLGTRDPYKMFHRIGARFTPRIAVHLMAHVGRAQ